MRNLRNIAIIAHVDHGKTTLTAAITKVLSEVGQSDHIHTYDMNLYLFFILIHTNHFCTMILRQGKTRVL